MRNGEGDWGGWKGKRTAKEGDDDDIAGPKGEAVGRGKVRDFLTADANGMQVQLTGKGGGKFERGGGEKQNGIPKFYMFES